jgi:hypothetical protein
LTFNPLETALVSLCAHFPQRRFSTRQENHIVSQPNHDQAQPHDHFIRTTDRYYNSSGWVGRQRDRAGRLSHGCIAWMLGLPLPIIILAFLWRGCD